MLGFVIILGGSFVFTTLGVVIHGFRDGWHTAYGRMERRNIAFTAFLLAVYGAYLLGGQ